MEKYRAFMYLEINEDTWPAENKQDVLWDSLNAGFRTIDAI
jgi:hypothetical protein